MFGLERARIQGGKREGRCSSRRARKERTSGSRDSSAKNGLPEAEERAKGRRGGRERTQQVAGREQEVWAGRRPWARGRGWMGVSAIAIRDPSPISRPRQPQPRPLDITPRPPPACENAQSSVPDWSRCLTSHAPILALSQAVLRLFTPSTAACPTSLRLQSNGRGRGELGQFGMRPEPQPLSQHRRRWPEDGCP